MGQVFTASFENVTVSAAQDLFEVYLYQGLPVTFHSLFLYNVGADVGDAEEEMLRIQLRWFGHTVTAGSGGSNPDAYPAVMTGLYSETASVVDVTVNNTTVATTTGVNNLRGVGGWNIRMPFERVWTPETRPTFDYDYDGGGVGRALVRLAAAPADAISMSGELTFEAIA